MEELGIKIIPVERLWQTFQDRLMVELRLAQVKTLKEIYDTIFFEPKTRDERQRGLRRT